MRSIFPNLSPLIHALRKLVQRGSALQSGAWHYLQKGTTEIPVPVPGYLICK
ncbi:hypothetical protein PAXINDRAFT_170503 [Paxillus involutus ATCC 200175]|uniref:Uncharacterized protein n=1 Tax=Paxillus involutus ATCC 200175 TaxID=664439 RepID=A0A0C9TCY1_PAXIN|nr:hypothetical protein PAXINDRAFT_170503 [Paxillus involutus ATCC 200175]